MTTAQKSLNFDARCGVTSPVDGDTGDSRLTVQSTTAGASGPENFAITLDVTTN